MKDLPLTTIEPGTKLHPHRASARPDCCSAGASGPAMQHGGGSKLKGLLRVPLRLPSASPLALLNFPWLALHAGHGTPRPSPEAILNHLLNKFCTAAWTLGGI